MAADRFRVLPFSCLREADLLDGSRGSSIELNSKAISAELGQCDVFVSHSWHDAALPKWVALQQWAGQFQRSKGREPTLWLDKACIDQSNISASLCLLPVFLSGCRELLVLCGRTYASRLWCVIELFVFVKMGGALERVIVVPVCD